MSDYISRKDLIDALNDNIRKSDMPFEWCQGMANAGYIIMHQPSADVRENVRGSLIEPYLEEYYGEWHYCSVCGSNMQGGNFCSECGADLRGEEDETD